MTSMVWGWQSLATMMLLLLDLTERLAKVMASAAAVAVTASELPWSKSFPSLNWVVLSSSYYLSVSCLSFFVFARVWMTLCIWNTWRVQ